jgi:hypothetical protein
MKDIRPINTAYNGYLFRSRTEARWAVFFDALDERYEYEEEGFETEGGIRYLPDFHMLDHNEVYFEIKHENYRVTPKDKEKWHILTMQKPAILYVAFGAPWYDRPLYCVGHKARAEKMHMHCCPECESFHALAFLILCPGCAKLGFVMMQHWPIDNEDWEALQSIWKNDAAFLNAFKSARQARFEF